MYGPIIDGDLVPDYMYRLFAQGKFNVRCVLCILGLDGRYGLANAGQTKHHRRRRERWDGVRAEVDGEYQPEQYILKGSIQHAHPGSVGAN